MRNIVKLGVYLLMVGVLAGIGVAYVNSATEPVIAYRESEDKMAGLKEVCPEADTVENETDKYLGQGAPAEIREINVAYRDSQPVGVIYTVAPRGYGGPVVTLVGFDIAHKEITRIKILSQEETPGLGAQCEEPWFAQRFQGKDASLSLEVTKKKPVKDNQVAAITASTITSKAVTQGVNMAREHFMDHFAR